MYRVVVDQFGGVEQLRIEEQPEPTPNPDEVVIRFTSIGMNHADLMARRGAYRLVSGNPPFTPGLEGGGVIVSIGANVRDRTLGQKVILTLDAPASRGIGQGTYQSHYCIAATKTILAPDALPEHLLGALWLPYLTAWGCLVWQQNIQPGQRVLLPAASSSVAIAASQIVKHYGGIAIGTTTSPSKIEHLQTMPEARFDHLIAIQDETWWRTAKQLTGGKGYNIIFDPIAAGTFLHHEIRLLASHGTLWIYGLLGQPDTVDVSPLIRKQASLRGWLLNQISGSDIEQTAYHHILDHILNGTYQLPIAQTFPLKDIQNAHTTMEAANHIGKLLLLP